MSDKKDFTARARQQLEDWDYQLDRLSARLNDLRDEWRDEAREKLNEMKGRRSDCLLYTSPSPRDPNRSRMPSSA